MSVFCCLVAGASCLEASDLVEIRGTIEKPMEDGSKRLLAAPHLVTVLGQWIEIEDGGSTQVPSKYSKPSIPVELADEARWAEREDREEGWTTNEDRLLIAAQPIEFEDFSFGMVTRIRPYAGPDGEILIDCRVERKEIAAWETESDPIVRLRERQGAEPKRTVLLANERRVPRIYNAKEVFRVSSESSRKTLSASPHDLGIEVNLEAKRVAPPAVETKKEREGEERFFITTKFIEFTSDSPGVGVVDDLLPPSPVLTDPQFQMWIRKWAQTKSIDLLSAPSIVLRPGNKGIIEVLEEFIYPVSYDPPRPATESEREALSAAVTEEVGEATEPALVPSSPTAFETMETGVLAELTARRLPDGRIELSMEQTVRSVEGHHNFGTPVRKWVGFPIGVAKAPLAMNELSVPEFSHQVVRSVARVPDGGSLVLGGLIREDLQSVEEKIPVLGDLPVLGVLGRKSWEERVYRHLFFVVTVKSIDPAGR